MVRTLFTITSLVLLWIFAGPTSAQPKEVALPAAGLPRQIVGMGATLEKAKQNAPRQAAKELADFMKEHGLTSFVPTEDYVVLHALKDSGRAGPQEEIKVGEEKLQLHKWLVEFRPDSSWWQDVVRRDQLAKRLIVAEERQWFAGRFIAGLAVVLLAGFGYVQLDQRTQHRYTNWLRVAGVGIVSVVLAAFWWFVQM